MAIDGIIPQQNYELIRDRIAEILSVELISQGTKAGVVYSNGVDIERFIPYNADTEYPIINVVFEGGFYDNKDQKTSEGNYKYFIIGYEKAKSDATNKGDKKAAIKLGRLLGVCRAILENPIYNRLAFPIPTRETAGASFYGTNVGAIKIPKFLDSGDTENSIMGYLEFNVRVDENVILIEPVPLASSVTEVKLYNTDLGYRWGPDGDELEFLMAEDSTDETPIYLIAE